jgi:DNA-binding NtrC family response regulator
VEQRLEFLKDVSAERETSGDMSRVLSDLAHLALPEALEAFEKRLIAAKLAQNQECTGKTAAQLGISVRTLQRKIKRYGLCVKNDKDQRL